MNDKAMNGHDDEKLRLLIKGFAGGDRDATEKVIELHYRMVFHNCHKLTGDAHLSEDITHEAFMKAIRYRSTYDFAYKFSNWLLKISTNLCFDHLKRNRRERADGTLTEYRNELTDTRYQPDTDEKMDRETVRESLKRLPAIYSAPMMLRYYNGLSYEEIAFVMNLPLGTVKFRLNRAKSVLSKLLSSLMK